MVEQKHLNSIQLIFLAASMLSMSACASTSVSNRTFKIENNIAECKEIKIDETVTYKNILLLHTSVKNISNTGVCGCKSAALRYSAVDETTNTELSSGIFLDSPKVEYYFPVLTDSLIFKNSSIKLSISCENAR